MVLALLVGMTTEITIYPPQANLSPYQQRMNKAPDIVNDDFFAGFADLLDIVNPLQQLPGISTAYRELSGDTISSGARLLGGTLFGGPFGFLVALANEIIQSDSGKDIGGSLFAAASGKYEEANGLS
jgi:hypothetical protein